MNLPISSLEKSRIPVAAGQAAAEFSGDSADLLRQAAFAQFNPNPVLELAADGTINYCNAATEALTHQLGLGQAGQILPPQTSTIVRNCLATGQSHLRLEIELRGRTISWSFFPVSLNKVVHCYGGDISGRKQAEAELRRNAELLRRILLSSRDCIKTLDLEGRLLSMNEGGRCLMEIDDLNSVLNRPWTSFWQGHYHDAAVAALAKVRSGGIGQFLGHCLTAKSAPKWWDVLLTPILDSAGRVEYLLAVSRDITKSRALEEQLRQSQKMEAIGQLSGGVAHDFNNLLTVIKGYIGLLRAKGQVAPEITGAIQQIEDAADRAANLTRQLLTFSRQQVMQPADFNLTGVVLNLSKMLRRLLSESIKMEVEAANQPLPIRADEGMVEQVLLNLVVNARDAMPKAGRLMVRTAAVDFPQETAAPARPGAFACLEVSDTGTGIAPEILPRIFEPFFTTKGVGKGTGLGLATVYGVMQQHGGWISVESTPGQGTTFRAYFPRQAGALPVTAASAAPTALRGGHEGILLVEDESTVRKIAQVALTGLGYQVFQAPSGREALQIWEAHRHEIKLLLTDLVMPDGVTGRDLAVRLCASEPRLPVIYMSGYNHDVAGDDFPLHEGVNYLPKPFDFASLTQIVRTSLDRGGTKPPFAMAPT